MTAGSPDFPITILTVTRSERTRVQVQHDLLARGAGFPSGTYILEWYRDAYPPHDRLDNPHRSVYGSLADVEQGTGGDVRIDRQSDYRQ